MKLLHISDLHIGKKLNGFSMLDNQEHILYQILDIVDEEKPDAVLIAGDIYDKTIPSTEAIGLCDDFLVKLSHKNAEVFIISGNHDSAERLAFGNRLIEKSGIHISPVYDGKVEANVLEDQYGKVNIYMLPFVKPAHVRRFHDDVEINDFTDAVRTCVEDMNIDVHERNVLVAHQFITNAQKADSEEMMVGGLENVDRSAVEDFDYVALGHIHRPQTIAGKIRYCGTPLKYSFSEKDQDKSVTIVEMGAKGEMELKTVPLKPLVDMCQIKGKYDEITDKAYYSGKEFQNAFLRVVLTDDDYIPNAMAKLRMIYPNVMVLDYDNQRTRNTAGMSGKTLSSEKSPLDNFKELFETINSKAMSKEQEDIITELVEEIWGKGEA